MAIAAHAGNWEYTVMGYGLLCRPGVVVGRELDQPWAARFARYLRERGGNYMVGKQKGMKGIMGHLRAKRPVGISSTRTPPLRGAFWLTFSATRPVPPRWRRPSWPGGGCRLARPVPAPGGRRHLMVILPPLPLIKTADPQADIQRHLELQSRTIEAWVRMCPEQWLWSTGGGKTSFRRFMKKAISCQLSPKAWESKDQRRENEKRKTGDVEQ